MTPRASLTAPQNENDRDTMAAYKLLGVGDYTGASKMAAQIAKRDPKYTNLCELRSAIQKVEQTEKKRAAPEPPKPAATEPTITVLPGGGFVAPSDLVSRR